MLLRVNTYAFFFRGTKDKRGFQDKGERKSSVKQPLAKVRAQSHAKRTQDSVEVELAVQQQQQQQQPKVVKEILPKKATHEKTKLTSRPMHEKSLIALADKVKKRKEPRPRRSDKPRSVDEDPFPRPQPGKKSKKKRTKPPKTEEFVPRIDSAWLLPEANMFDGGEKSSMELAVRPTDTTLPHSGLPIIRGNNDNNGVILMDGQPFWATNIAPDDTDDELVMNAAVLVDVLENRLKLVPMPDVEIVLDPLEETTVLAARDSSCYTKEVIFGNTVRSMVNLNELSIRALSIKGRKKQVTRVYGDELKPLFMLEPTIMNTYYRKTYDRSRAVSFTPSMKKTAQPPSCTDAGLQTALPEPKGTI
ncbi:hypothetical protein Aduo_003742 [Ancylostoma duodenale]